MATAKEIFLKKCCHENILEAGCDEAGRGCLAGPVVAAAVILTNDFYHPQLNDSKQVSAKTRSELRVIIEEKAIAYAVAIVDNLEIDRINIHHATILAMHKALSMLSVVPEHIIVDGNKFKPYLNIRHTCVVKGDSIYNSIAAASILAKTYRDEIMVKLSCDYPQYHWDINKGYATAVHRKAVEQFGITPSHRKTFLKDYGQFNLEL
jgi:ribonuclease HII